MSQQKVCEFCIEGSDDGETKVASGYCQTCDGYLCQSCFETHTSRRIYKTHVLLNLNTDASGYDFLNYTENKVGNPVDLIFQKCGSHGNDRIGFYCVQHDKTGCGSCMILNHKECEIQSLDVLDDKVFGTVEYSESHNSVLSLLDDVTHLQDDVRAQTKAEDQMRQTCKDDVLQFRKDIDEKLDYLQTKILLEIDKAKAHNELVFMSVRNTCEKLKENLTGKVEAFRTNLALHHRCKAYVAQNRVKKEVPELKETFKTAKAKLHWGVQRFLFNPNRKLADEMFKEILSFGVLEEDVTGSDELRTDEA